MKQRTYLQAIKEAELDLEKMKKEEAEIVRKTEALEHFIQSGRALAGRRRKARVRAATRKAASNSHPRIADHVAEILKQAGKPLHLKDIVEQLQAKRTFATKDPTSSVAVAIRRRGRQFKRVKPNTFKLAKPAA